MEMRGLFVLMIVAFGLGTRVHGQPVSATQPIAVDIEYLTFFKTLHEPEKWIDLLNAMHVEESVLKACAQHAQNTRQQAKTNYEWCMAEWKMHKDLWRLFNTLILCGLNTVPKRFRYSRPTR